MTGEDRRFQDELLPGVSRTFALTIPQLPRPLRDVVTNAYLLCRIADTIEDEVSLDAGEKRAFHDLLTAAVSGGDGAAELVRDLVPRLSAQTSVAERALVADTARVVAVTHGFPERPRAAVARCVAIMCERMPEFQRTARLSGLADLAELDRYCYSVAGVVGEMLTELFCDYSAAAERNRAALMSRAVSFGQGLQMTNILKDVWEDRARGVCWLPRDLFARRGVELGEMTITSAAHDAGATGSSAASPSPDVASAFADGMAELVEIARGHLRNALEYTLAIPSSEPGIRRFCLWALALAVLTLRKIEETPGFTSGAQVKVSRRVVRATAVATALAARSDRAIRWWFGRAGVGEG
ncbi:MAG TPA: phytoene/squalene synthase family protein [Gemmatimonadaceae bacterium]|nr:phytoene/squalene synthase family protein [Gemmatimonadaceae bacterium]